jgi:hypothetical protein
LQTFELLGDLSSLSPSPPSSKSFDAGMSSASPFSASPAPSWKYLEDIDGSSINPQFPSGESLERDVEVATGLDAISAGLNTDWYKEGLQLACMGVLCTQLVLYRFWDDPTSKRLPDGEPNPAFHGPGFKAQCGLAVLIATCSELSLLLMLMLRRSRFIHGWRGTLFLGRSLIRATGLIWLLILGTFVAAYVKWMNNGSDDGTNDDEEVVNDIALKNAIIDVLAGVPLLLLLGVVALRFYAIKSMHRSHYPGATEKRLSQEAEMLRSVLKWNGLYAIFVFAAFVLFTHW